jgi:hypothetical protein
MRADHRWRSSSVHARAGLATLLIALAAAAVVAGPPLASTAWDQFRKPIIESRDDPAARLGTLSGTRYQVWSVALDAFDEHPTGGTGAGTFEFWWNRTASSKGFLRDAHSLYLEALAEAGWPGLLLVALFLLAAGWSLLLSRARAGDAAQVGAVAASASALVVFVVHAGVDWMWETTAVTALALVGFGVASAAAARTRWRAPPALRAGLVLVALVAGAIQLPGLASVTAMRESQEAVEARDLGRALGRADDAIAAEPWAARPYLQRGLVREINADYAGARRDLSRAASREPTNWRHRLILARLEARLGRPAASLAAVRRARALAPTLGVFGSQRPPLDRREPRRRR